VNDEVVNEVDCWSIDREADVMPPCMSSSHKEATHTRHNDDMAYTPLPKTWWFGHCWTSTQVCRMQTVYRIDDKLMIDPIGGEMGAVGAAAAGDGPMTLTFEIGKSLMLRSNRSDQQMSQFQAQVQTSFAQQLDRFDHKFRTINNNIRCFGGTIKGSLLIQQAKNGRWLRRVGEALPAEGNQDFLSTLSPNPRSLRELWLEYKFGIDGRKLAEQFTTTWQSFDIQPRCMTTLGTNSG
jgi:hypothetical protein